MVWQTTYRKKGSLFALISAVFFTLSLPSVASHKGGNPMDIILLNEAGEKVRLDQMAAGKPVLLYFWATWCKPCRTTTPKVDALAKKYKDQVQVLGINVGGVDTLKDVKKYRSQYRITYPLLLDLDNEAMKAFSIIVIPTIILVDRTGKIRYRDNDAPADLKKLLQR